MKGTRREGRIKMLTLDSPDSLGMIAANWLMPSLMFPLRLRSTSFYGSSQVGTWEGDIVVKGGGGHT